MASCKDKSWLEVVIKIPPEMDGSVAMDLISSVPSLLWRQERHATGSCLLKAVVAMDPHVDRMISQIEAAVKRVEQKQEIAEYMAVELHAFEAEEPMGSSPSQQDRPLQVSSRLAVGSPWGQVQAPQDQTVLLIDPQEAFGDGNHPSTRLALRLLDELLGGKYGGAAGEDAWVLDAGCGSGVLALAAAALGGFKVLAVDLDPRAIDAARENIRHNTGPGSKVSLTLGELSCARGPFFVVLANLVPPVHLRAHHALWQAVAPKGWLILSGFCQSHKDAILRPYVQNGACEKGYTVDQAWAGCLLHKPKGQKAHEA